MQPLSAQGASSLGTSALAPRVPRRLALDLDRCEAVLDDGAPVPLGDPRAFAAIAEAFTRSGWAARYAYGFSWCGRGVVQLPEDLVRLQEAVYALKPDVLVETGVAHGGSLLFYASLFAAMGHGRVVGVEIQLAPQTRIALETHPLASLLTLVEGSSTDPAVVARVQSLVAPGEHVFLVLDSAHTRDHVRSELEAYAGLIAPGGYIAVADGVMRDLVGLPRSEPGWATDNPAGAVDDFLAAHPEFERGAPDRPYDESGLPEIVTYFRSGWLRRVAQAGEPTAEPSGADLR